MLKYTEEKEEMTFERNKNYSEFTYFSVKYGGFRRVTSRGKLLRPGRSDFLRLERDYRAAAARSEN